MNENDFFDEPQSSGEPVLTLDNRQEQLSEKIDRELGASSQEFSEDTEKVTNTVNTGSNTESVNLSKDIPEVNNTAVQNSQQKTNAPAQQQNAAAYNYARSNNPYESGGYITDYTGGAMYKQAPAKPPLGSGVKAYIIAIVGLCVIFFGMFVFECYSQYTTNGGIGSNLDDWLESYGNYGNFSLPDIYENDDSDDEADMPEIDPDSDKEKDKSESNVSDRKAAPDADKVVNEKAANLNAEDQPEDIDSGEYTARNAYREVEKSVVNIIVYTGEVGDEDTKDGTGSGIIISEDGYIVTNSHVIDDSKSVGVEVIASNGSSYAAAVVGFDIRTDLAVIKIDETGLKPAHFVNSDQIEVGQDAIAVGSPGGVEYSHSLTRGCVSALNRTVSSNGLVHYIQTDAAINPGNSGGPLLNSAGQVMGINTIKVVNTEYEGMGFAIPSNTVIEIANDLISLGYVSNRVRLGVQVSNYAPTSIFSTDDVKGVSVVSIMDDSPLKGTDVKEGDVITAINGESVTNIQSLFSEMGKYAPGDTVTLKIYRPASSSRKSTEFEAEVTFVADNGETQK